MTNTGLEFMIMIIHPWLSDHITLPPAPSLPPFCPFLSYKNICAFASIAC